MKLHRLAVVGTLGGILLAGSATAADSKGKTAPPKPKPYPLKECVVSGLELEDSALSFVYEDREIKTCCEQCQEDFYKDPPHYVEKIEEAEQKQAGK
jgi:hypothetical protein